MDVGRRVEGVGRRYRVRGGEQTGKEMASNVELRPLPIKTEKRHRCR